MVGSRSENRTDQKNPVGGLKSEIEEIFDDLFRFKDKKYIFTTLIKLPVPRGSGRNSTITADPKESDSFPLWLLIFFQ